MSTPSLAWTELVGYAASALVAASLMMSNARRLRLVNLVGALTFSAYGLLVGAWPVLLVNLLIACVNVYYLRQMSRRADFFHLFPVHGGDAFVQEFLRYHRADIGTFFPDLDDAQVAASSGWFVLRNMLPVGLFVYRPDGAASEGRVEILLDYAIADYRDHKNAEFLFRVLNEKFAAEGKREFVLRSGVPEHQRYLLREGFRATDGGRFVRPIA